MIATVINGITVLLGTVVGLLIKRGINESLKSAVFTAVGAVTLIIGMSMALGTQRFLYLALALVTGGLLGTAWKIEDAIYRFGEFLKRRVSRGSAEGVDDHQHFAQGFLTASVLFCVGAMTIIGAFQAGVEHDYGLILTKSVMDGFMAVLLTAAYGIGVGFSVISILIYQGGLTLLSGLLRPFVSDLMLSEISAVGGAMVLMIGFNLLDLRKVKTADFLPALLVIVLFVLIDPWIGSFVM